MKASLRALLSGVVDYAGIFPPAKLPLDEAIRNYALYRQDADAWILGRFVARADMPPKELTFPLSIVARGGDERTALLKSVAADLKAIESFRSVNAYELKGPFDPESVLSAADLVLGSGAVLFYEIAFIGDWRRRIGEVAAAVAAFNTDYPDDRAALKLRCGGLEASAFPSVEQAAFVLHACRDAGVSLKFTAGMHHPIRRFDADIQTHMHGFINVFTAGVLAHARRLGAQELGLILANEDASDFVFTEDGLKWKDQHASTAEILTARREFVTSFGCCSFDEPRDDLRALGWL
jgi:hypothetical protein